MNLKSLKVIKNKEKSSVALKSFIGQTLKGKHTVRVSFDVLCKRRKDGVTVKPAIYPDIHGTNESWLTALDYRKSNLATKISQ